MQSDIELVKGAISREISFLEDNAYRYKLQYGPKNKDYLEQYAEAEHLRKLLAEIIQYLKQRKIS